LSFGTEKDVQEGRARALKPKENASKGLGAWLARHAVYVPGKKHTHETHGWRGSVNSALHGDRAHKILNSLLILDLLALIVGMILELQYIEGDRDAMLVAFKKCVANSKLCPDPSHMGHYGDHMLHELVEITEYASMSILAIFFLENMMLVLANGTEFFMNPWHALDLIVVVVSLGFELEGMFGNNEAGGAVGLLVIARSWRFIRIGHGIHEMDASEEEAGIGGGIRELI